MDIDDLRASIYWSEREGRAAIALWKRSGIALAAFARREGLSRGRLTYWRSRLDAAAPCVVELAPVTIVDSRPRASTIAIELISGRVVRVESDVDDALLARVIAIAERAC